MPRSVSTWFAYELIKYSGLKLIFEPFHESLGELNSELLNERFLLLNKGTALRHPIIQESYYENMLFGLNGYVDGFKKEFSFKNYFLEPNQSDKARVKYLKSIIEFNDSKNILIKYTKSNLRIGWLKRNLDGKHIYLVRNPRLLDNSHFSFRGYSNQYIRDYVKIVHLNKDSELFQEVYSFINPNNLELKDHLRLIASEKLTYNREYHFTLLSFFWILSLAHASQYVDLIVSTDLLWEDNYRKKVCDYLRVQNTAFDGFKTLIRNTRTLKRHDFSIHVKFSNVVSKGIEKLGKFKNIDLAIIEGNPYIIDARLCYFSKNSKLVESNNPNTNCLIEYLFK